MTQDDSERIRRVATQRAFAVEALTVAILAGVCLIVLAIAIPLVIMLWRWAIG